MPFTHPVFSFIALLLALYLALVGFLYLAQRLLQYHPNQTIPTPAAYGAPEMAAIRIPNDDGQPLLAWFRAPTEPGAPTLVYFHGNAGHLGDRADKVRPYLDAGYGVLLAGYRYNAGAGGSPSEAGLIADGRAALDHVITAGAAPGDVALYGESLGSGVAVALAAEQAARGAPVAAVLLEAPFTSVADVAAQIYWYVPARWLLKDRFDSLALIDAINAPLIIGHGGSDGLVPVTFGRQLFDAAEEPKRFFTHPEARHSNIDDFGFAAAAIAFVAAQRERP
ncbi:MAG: alpha/beta hydrolase [Alphaproteobacteria bacterium]|nr:alpha/beta hydrolase [Alphaproteobacteria bacterium]